MSQPQQSSSFPTTHRSNAKCFRTPWSSLEQRQHLLYLETNQNNGYPDCKTSASVARERILLLFNGGTTQYVRWGPFRPCLQRHRYTMHQCHLRAQSEHPAHCQLCLPLYQPFSTNRGMGRSPARTYSRWTCNRCCRLLWL